MKNKLIIIIVLPFIFSSCLTRILRKSSSSDTFKTYHFSNERIYNQFKWGDNKNAVLIPVKIDNYPDTVYFQLDLGTGWTILYEQGISIIMQDSSIRKKIYKNKGRYYYNNPTIRLNETEYLNCSYLPIYNLSNKDGYMIENDTLAKKYNHNNQDFLIIGTLGYDFIYNKTIVLDFKNNEYCLSYKFYDSLLQKDIYKIKASVSEWPLIIKTKYRNKRKRFIFDTGSSSIGLALFKKEWNKSKGYDVDTLKEMMGWGRKMFTVQKTTFEKMIINNEVFSDFPIITSEAIETQKFGFRLLRADGVIGNYLFFNSSIIIDTRNDKMWIIKVGNKQ